MIGYLKGTVAGIYDDNVVIEVGGVGMNVHMPASAVDMIDGIGTDIKVYTYLHVREDAMTLFGFLTKDDLELYKLLISVNGVGPKGALALLSMMSADDLRFAILSQDSKMISKAPGVGAKTAQRIIIDLKDKIDPGLSLDHTVNASDDPDISMQGTARQEAVLALVALGYSQSAAVSAVRAADAADDDVESILKAALSNI
ncbi:MAG: Holliday junction branch migration protein RuvA [Lachnospiraceae bacterium]|nr:Holliday junction branch migration protein RuvA [Lachnospiraceae bacterium]